MRILCVVLVGSLALACGDRGSSEAPSEGASSPAPAPTPPPAPEAAPEAAPEPAPEPARVAPPPPPPPIAERRRVRQLVRDARAAAARHRPEAAIEAFRAALAISPRDPRLHCELGYLLSESDRAGAERHLDRGIDLYGDPEDLAPPLARGLAMCLYNRGRLIELGDEPSEAADYYQESLELRDNGIVREHLRAVGGLTHSSGEVFELTSVAELERRLEAPYPCTDAQCRQNEEDCHLCHRDYDVLATLAAAGGLPEIAWLESHDVSDMVDEVHYDFAIRRPNGYVVIRAVEQMEDNTDHGHDSDGDLTPGDASMLANGWLMVRYRATYREGGNMMIEPEEPTDEDADCWVSESSSSSTESAVLCRLDDEVSCAQIELGQSGGGDSTVVCNGPDGNVDPPPWARQYEHTGRGSGPELALEFRDDRVRLHAVRGTVDPGSQQTPLERWMSPDEFWETLEEVYAY